MWSHSEFPRVLFAKIHKNFSTHNGLTFPVNPPYLASNIVHNTFPTGKLATKYTDKKQFRGARRFLDLQLQVIVLHCKEVIMAKGFSRWSCRIQSRWSREKWMQTCILCSSYEQHCCGNACTLPFRVTFTQACPLLACCSVFLWPGSFICADSLGYLVYFSEKIFVISHQWVWARQT